MKTLHTWKASLLVLFVCLFLLSLSACGQSDKQQNKGHDTYYSSNVDPQFTPSYPPEDHMGQLNNGLNNDAQMRSNSLRDNFINGNAATGQYSEHGTMMNGQAMNDQQKRIMDEILKVPGVNDATVIVNDKTIVVGIDVNNVGERARVVADVKQMLEHEHTDYQVSVTAERAMYNRIQNLREHEAELKTKAVEQQGMEDYSFMEDLRALLNDIGNTVTEPLR